MPGEKQMGFDSLRFPVAEIQALKLLRGYGRQHQNAGGRGQN
jgi:hypothetical protein